MLNTLHLRTFLTVLELGSFSAAAEKLHMSQPAVSQQIKALEEQLGGVRLFRRAGQRMVSTIVGEELAASARELVGLAERTEQHILSMRGRLTGRLALGCSAAGGDRFLPTLLAAFHAQHEGVTIELEVAPPERLVEELNNGNLAILLLEEQARRRGWEYQPLARENLVLIAPAGHALLQEERIPPGVLRDEPVILPRSGSAPRRAIDDALRRRDVAIGGLRPVFETDSSAATLHAVAAGMGLAFLPRSCLPHRLEQIGTIALPGQPPQIEWFIARLRERSYPRAAALLWSYLQTPPAYELLSRFGLSRQEQAQ